MKITTAQKDVSQTLQARILEWATISFSSLPFFPVPVLPPTLSGKCHFNSGTIHVSPILGVSQAVAISALLSHALSISSLLHVLSFSSFSNQFKGVLESKEIDVYVHSTILT